ncbi:8037_t:CDS:2, partial [Gigaspora rosea]
MRRIKPLSEYFGEDRYQEHEIASYPGGCRVIENELYSSKDCAM